MEKKENNERIFCELGVTSDEIKRVFFAAYGYSNYNHHREDEFEEFYNKILRNARETSRIGIDALCLRSKNKIKKLKHRKNIKKIQQ
jgi:hypothetical protein